MLCAAIAAMAARRPAAVGARRVALAVFIAALLMAIGEPLFAFVLARYAYAHFAMLWYTAEVLGVCLLAGALAAPFAWRINGVRALVIAAELAAAAGAEAWLALRHFQHIAIYGP